MVLILILLAMGSVTALPSAPAPMKVVLGAFVVIAIFAGLTASIVLEQYISVGQGFLYEELKQETGSF